MRQVMALAMMVAAVLSALGGATQSTGQVVPIQSMTTPRAAHSATLLADGRVLIAGGCTQGTCDSGPATQTAEIFDPQTRGFTLIGKLVQPRLSHAAVPLEGGAVMVLGGWVSGRVTASTERFDSAARAFSPAPEMLEARADFSATVLKDGRVLIAGGYRNRVFLNTAEIFDPRSNQFSPTGELIGPRGGHTATRLSDGRVLLVGGSAEANRVLASAELFDPTTNRFSQVPDLGTARRKHATVGLPDGRVLVVGGSSERDSAGRFNTTEVFHPSTNRFTPGPRMSRDRFKFGDAVAVLPDGRVLTAGGASTAEVFDPRTNTWQSVRGDLGANWSFMTATTLQDGRVLLVGGYDDRIRLTDRAWLYQP
jgi:hypothetical protein